MDLPGSAASLVANLVRSQVLAMDAVVLRSAHKEIATNVDPHDIPGLDPDTTAILNGLRDHFASGGKGPYVIPPNLVQAMHPTGIGGVDRRSSVRTENGKKVDFTDVGVGRVGGSSNLWEHFRGQSSTGEDGVTDDPTSDYGVTDTDADVIVARDVLDRGGLIGSDPDTLVFPEGRAVSDSEQVSVPVDDFVTDAYLDDWSVATRSKRAFGRKVIKRNKRHTDQPLQVNLRRRGGGGSGL